MFPLVFGNILTITLNSTDDKNAVLNILDNISYNKTRLNEELKYVKLSRENLPEWKRKSLENMDKINKENERNP